MKRSASQARAPEAKPPASIARVIATAGRPLDADVRATFEPRFAHSFADVRIHDDSEARMSARDAGALAYTYGSHIILGRNASHALLAHELAHVVQQHHAGASLQTKRAVSEPGDADERDADAAANIVLAGGNAMPLRAANARMHRKVQETVAEQTKPFAKACVIHLHNDELNAFATAQAVQAKHCVNFVHIVDPQARVERSIHIDVSNPAGTCTADPNRIFSHDAVTKRAISCADKKNTDEATNHVRAFRTNELNPAISRCRGGNGTGLAGPLPVLALHTNTPGGKTGIHKIKSSDLEKRASILGTLKNPRVDRAADPDDYTFTTHFDDFAATTPGATAGAAPTFTLQGNVALQSTNPKDDGSLSVALRSERYAVIEKEEAQRKPGVPMPIVAASVPEAESVLGLYGALNACPAPTAAQQQEFDERRAAWPSEATDPAERQRREAAQSARRAADIERDRPPVGASEAPPASLRARDDRDEKSGGCRFFSAQSQLDDERQRWLDRMEALTEEVMIRWITGQTGPPSRLKPNPQTVSQRQLTCMLKALKASAKKKGTNLVLPAGDLKKSGHRSFATQRNIWRTEKFTFTRDKPFDRISDAARAHCGTFLLPRHEFLWDTNNERHKFCWLPKGEAAIPAGFTPPANFEPLTPELKQKEILQASSAPGTSRHHWGTDYDIVDPDMRAEDWEKGGSFADEYSWLRANAAKYGFIQSFTRESAALGIAHMEERWHWSYWPVADAIVTYLSRHDAKMDSMLKAAKMSTAAGDTVGTAKDTSHVSANWRNLLFNVNRKITL